MNKLDTVILDNGLKIYLYNDKRRHSTFFQFTTFCGGISKHFKVDGEEYNLQDGVAHILEHYIVECNQEGNFLDKLGEAQMSTNAATSLTTTTYYFETVEKVDLGIKILLEGINNVTFTTEKLEKSKKPIYQEIRGKLDNKFYHVNRMRINNIFKNFDFRDVGGLVEEIRDTKIEDLEILYKAFYQPSNQFIVIGGNFDKNAVIEQIKAFYNNLDAEKHNVEILDYKEDSLVNKKMNTLIFPTPINYYELSFKVDISKYSAEELLDLDFYLHCFYGASFGITSPLYKKLVEQKVIIDYIYCHHIIINKYLIITIGADTNNYEVFKKSILNEISNPSLDEDKFELDKKSSIVNLVMRDESIFKTIFPLIDNIIIYNYPYLDETQDIYKLTYDDYIKYIHGIDFSNYTSILVKNS